MEKQKFAVYTRIPGAQKPAATEWHYAKPAAESRATKLRQQASSRGWNVSIEVCGPFPR